MTLRERIVNQLKLDEGFRATSYWDMNHWSWGYGTPAPGPQMTITPEEAEVELNKKLDEAFSAYYAIFYPVTTEINEVRQAALINMIYNLGPMGLYKFKRMYIRIKWGQWKEAANEARQSLWYKQVTRRAERICKELESG